MKKIIGIILVNIICLTSIAYANYNWENIRGERSRKELNLESVQEGDAEQWLIKSISSLIEQSTEPIQVIGKTNDSLVVVKEDGVELIPFNQPKPWEEYEHEIFGGTSEDTYKDLYEINCNKCGKTWNITLKPYENANSYVESERCSSCDSDRLNFHYKGATNSN